MHGVGSELNTGLCVSYLYSMCPNCVVSTVHMPHIKNCRFKLQQNNPKSPLIVKLLQTDRRSVDVQLYFPCKPYCNKHELLMCCI